MNIITALLVIILILVIETGFNRKLNRLRTRQDGLEKFIGNVSKSVQVGRERDHELRDILKELAETSGYTVEIQNVENQTLASLLLRCKPETVQKLVLVKKQPVRKLKVGRSKK